MPKKALKTRLYYFKRKGGVSHSATLLIKNQDGAVRISIDEFDDAGLKINQYGFAYTDLTSTGWRDRIFPAVRDRLFRWQLFLDGKALQEITEKIAYVR